MRSYSSGGTTPPVGLQGEFTIRSFVFGVIAFSIAAARTVNLSSGCVSTYTGVPPAYFTMSGKLTQQGVGTTTSSPCWINTLITLKMECLPPTLTTHSFGSNDECSSRLCHAQIASRNGAIPPAGVYFDLFSLIARIAAFLMCSGVGKSGSPGPKSATSMPFAFIFSASASTVAVGEIWIRLMRSVSCTSSSFVDGQVYSQQFTSRTQRRKHRIGLLRRLSRLRLRKVTTGRYDTFARNRCSTIGGTSPSSGPPCCAISRTSLELR